MLLDELRYTLRDLYFEVCRHNNLLDLESSFTLDFLEVCHDTSIFDSLISANDWFIGCFNSVSTLLY